MIHITELCSRDGATSPYRMADGREAWLPVAPLPFYSWPSRLRDAWAVFQCRATAVDFASNIPRRTPLAASLIVVLLCLLAGATPSYAQSTLVLTDSSALLFTASDSHALTFNGAPVLTSYIVEFFAKNSAMPGQAPTGTPLITRDVGKPTPDPVTNDIRISGLKTMIQPNTEYVLTVKAAGPGGTSARIPASDPFGYPGSPVPPAGKSRILP